MFHLAIDQFEPFFHLRVLHVVVDSLPFRLKPVVMLISEIAVFQGHHISFIILGPCKHRLLCFNHNVISEGAIAVILATDR